MEDYRRWKDFMVHWRDPEIEQPENSNDVLVVTNLGYIAIAAFFPDFFDGVWAVEEDCTWHIQTAPGYHEVWNDDKHGVIDYWAELPMDSYIIEPNEEAEQKGE